MVPCMAPNDLFWNTMYITPKAIFFIPPPYEEVVIDLWEALKTQALWPKIQTSCFTVTGVVNQRFEQLGHHAQAISGTVLAQYHDQAYKLGFPGITQKPGEIDGHIFSLINDKILIDFGLGNIKKYGLPQFPKAIAFEMAEKKFPITFKFDHGQGRWDTRLANPASHRIYEEHLALARTILKDCRLA